MSAMRQAPISTGRSKYFFQQLKRIKGINDIDLEEVNGPGTVDQVFA